MIQFLLNQEKIDLPDRPADTTVLRYLRDELQLCGTKEGCASGDCGACTVVVAEKQGQALRYRAVNSCITFIGSLQGKQLITVEHLASGNELHPVQQAMVDLHGSQCGFCTPGFVMSMFAMYKAIEQSLGSLNQAELRIKTQYHLGGNLCRCTGYRPIIDATLASVDSIAGDQFSRATQSTCHDLEFIADAVSAQNTASSMHPKNIIELNNYIRQFPEAPLVAGCTDLALEVTQKLQSIPLMIYLDQVTELLEVDESKESMTIGAGVTLEQCKTLFTEHWPQTAEIFDRFGSYQIRNQATIGGNIANASPIGDLPPLLIALGATLCLQLGDTQREITIDSFFIDYKKTALEDHEFIVSIKVPLPLPNQLLRIYKISKRVDDDISAVCMAISLTLSDTQDTGILDSKVAFGGMSAIPCRASRCESVLNHGDLTEYTIALAADAIEQDFSPISDARASSSYRTRVAKNLLKRFLLEMSDPSIATRVDS
ncbi:MAG: xanthine dehydrogenase small subunit [Acidiferrobacterales bacterium]|nr:xanthine dehydrogenase small subunit [Acidiferrobacterales bacterium]